MKIQALMMAKDEDQLLVPWVRHHARLFGAGNLLVFDNGTTNSIALEQLDWARDLGVIVDTTHPGPEAFRDKGSVMSTAIQRLDRDDPADFYFPLDCDEFVGLEVDGAVRFDRACLERELQGLRDVSTPLLIARAYDNNPARPDCYRPAPFQRKSFFTRGTCVWMDDGSHHAMTGDRSGDRKTNVIYVHFHYRPFPALVQHSKSKIACLIEGFDPSRGDEYFTTDKLNEYRANGMSCNHVFQHIEMQSEEDYLRSWREVECVKLPGFALALRAAGAEVPFRS